MLLELFEGEILAGLKHVNLEFLQEIRLRSECKISCLYNGSWYFLSSSGLDNREFNALKVNENQINRVLQKASNSALYTVSEQIKKGYITFNNGIRIGICGSAIFENGLIKNITKITSLCIRVPHLIYGAGKEIFSTINLHNELKNVLILSPSGCGKTTILKDIALKLSHKPENNLVLIDEKEEFSALKNKGLYLDIISQIDKENGINFAIRNLNPKVIITDEIGLKEDYIAILKASIMGSKIICSKHGNDIFDLKNDKDFEVLLSKQVFDYFVVIENKEGKGRVKKIYNKNLNLVRHDE